jgi:hypothetical protein
VEIPVTSEFRQICQGIISENRSEEEWALVESDDLFQSESYSGGFDATEMAFCFSYFGNDRNEFWFQCTLAQVRDVVGGGITELESWPASR